MKKKTCKRCGKLFTPERTRLRKMPFTRCCDTCKVRNLTDGLGLPTPPELLDRYTRVPTLTEEEYRRKLFAFGKVTARRGRRRGGADKQRKLSHADS